MTFKPFMGWLTKQVRVPFLTWHTLSTIALPLRAHYSTRTLIHHFHMFLLHTDDGSCRIQGQSVKSWKHRWFVLSNEELITYYAKKEDQIPKVLTE